MDDKFEEWYRNVGFKMAFRRFSALDNLHDVASAAYKQGRIDEQASVKSTKGKRLGCHLNNSYPISNYCALDDNDDKDNCPHAQLLYSQGESKDSCPYCRPIEETP